MDTDKIFKCFVPAWGCEGILKRVSDDQFLRQMLNDGATKQGQPRIYTVFRLKDLAPSPDTVKPVRASYADRRAETIHLEVQRPGALDRAAREITEWKVKHTPLIVAGAYSLRREVR